MSRRPKRSEHAEQVEVFKWAAKQEQAHAAGRPEDADVGVAEAEHLQLMFATLNGMLTHKRHAFEAKRAGARKGTPDIVVPPFRAGQPPLFIEFKPTRGGRVSPDQGQFLRRLNATGSLAVVAHGPEQAQEVIRRYLAGPAGSSVREVEGVEVPC